MSTKDRALGPAAARALEFLADVQEDDGDFAVFAATDRQLRRGAVLDSSPFNVAHVLCALGAFPGEAGERLRGRAAAYLLREADPERATWSYFARHTGRRLDDDLDDTACASAALRGAAPPAWLARNVRWVLGNRDERGLFRTWIRPPGAANDVDAVVNANVLFYLGDRPETAAAAAFLREIVARGEEAAHVVYYENELALYHALTRAHRAGAASLANASKAVAARLERRFGAGGAALAELGAVDLSFAALALLHAEAVGPALTALIGALLDLQSPDGSFPPAAVWNGPEPPAPRSVWWGGTPISTALAGECLCRAARARGAGTALGRSQGGRI